MANLLFLLARKITPLWCVLSLVFSGMPVWANPAAEPDPMTVFTQDMQQWRSAAQIPGATFVKTVNDFFGKNCDSSSCRTCLVVSTSSHSEYESHTWIGAFDLAGPQTMYSEKSATLKSGAEDTSRVLNGACTTGGSKLKCENGECCLVSGGRYEKAKADGKDLCQKALSYQHVHEILNGTSNIEGSIVEWINLGVTYSPNNANLMFHEGLACHNVGNTQYKCEGGSAGCVVIHPAAMQKFCKEVFVNQPMFFILDLQNNASEFSKQAAENYVALKKKGALCQQKPNVVTLGNISNASSTASAPDSKGGANTDPTLTGSEEFTSCNADQNGSYPDRVASVQQGEEPSGFLAEKASETEGETPVGGIAGMQLAAAAQENVNKNCHVALATESRTTGTTPTQSSPSNSSSGSGGGSGMLGAMIGIAAVGGIGAYAIIQSKKQDEEDDAAASGAREAEVAECRKIVNDSKAFGSQRERCRSVIAAYEEEEAKKNAYQSAYRDQVQSLPDDEMMSTDSALTVTNENDSDNTREYTHQLMAHYDESRRLEYEYGQEEKKQTTIDLTNQAQTYTESTDKQAEALNYQDYGRGRMTETLDGYQDIYSQRAALLQRDLAQVPTQSSLLSNCIQNTAKSGYDKTPIYDYLIAPARPYIEDATLEFNNQADCQNYISRNEPYLLTNKQIYGQAENAIQDTVNVVVGIQDIKDTLASQKLKGAELAAYLKNHPVLLELGERQIELEACAEIGCWNHPKTNTKVLSDAYGPSLDPGVNILYQNLQQARMNRRAPSGHDIFSDPAFSKYVSRAGFSHLGQSNSLAATKQKMDFKSEQLSKSRLEHKDAGLVGAKDGLNSRTNSLNSEQTNYLGGAYQASAGGYLRGEDGVLRSNSGKEVMGHEAPAHANLFQVISHRYRQKFFSDR